MKCGFCGKELAEGAEFCPECGMILSLGGVVEEAEEKEVNEANEVEVPEYTPNVFRAMEFEPEEEVPAMELEVTDEEETAEVVEIIPEYTQPVEDEAAEEIVEEAAEEIPEETQAAVTEEVQEEIAVQEEEFLAPEYDPEAKVSEEFLQQITENEAVEAEPEAETEAETEAVVYEEASEEQSAEAPVYEIADEEEIEYAPDEYEGELVSDEAAAVEEAYAYEAQEQSYPVYNEAQQEAVSEAKPDEDESLFAALFESAEAEAIEDITPDSKPEEKSSKKSYLSVAVLIVVLVGIVFAGGYVFKNVLPKIVDTSNTTTAATAEKVDGTTEKTTADKSTTEKTTAEKTTQEKTTTEKTTTKATTTEKTTAEKETTTKESTTEAVTDDSGEVVVVEPSAYNVDEVPFFPIEGDISIKAAPSSTSVDMITHPWGYPVYAYAKEGSYYYVHSPYLDYMGWVYEKDVEEYVEEGQTESVQSEEEVTDAPSDDGSTSYLAMINSAEGLNFRSGPGSEYGADFVVPGGFYVRVTAVSEENPGWVYVTVEDDRYPYGNPGGWVLEEYLV